MLSLGFPTESVKEGTAELLVPKLDAFKQKKEDYAPSKAPVFYNPRMKLNRDIAILVLQAYQRILNRDIYVAEPLAGCGVRGIRFAKEVVGIYTVLLNDINPEACRLAELNAYRNNTSRLVSISNHDANFFLSQYAAPYKRLDYVDIDPFGSPVPYLDSAIRALRDGGMLALTATDLAPLCGVYPKAALRKYGGLPLRTEYCHEIAVRLLSGCLAVTAAKHDIAVNILFSHSTDHYIRVYASLHHGARKADKSIQNMGFILHCFTCFHREISQGTFLSSTGRCSECGAPLKAAGPLWLGNIAERRFCERVEQAMTDRRFDLGKRVVKTVISVKEESDAPITYYVVDKICDKLGIPVPPLKRVIENLKKKGFQALPTHFHSRGVKTDAASSKVIEAIKTAL